MADQARLGGARAGRAARESERGAPPCSSIQSTDVDAGARRYCGVSTQPKRSEDAFWQYGQCRSWVVAGRVPAAMPWLLASWMGVSTCASPPATWPEKIRLAGPA